MKNPGIKNLQTLIGSDLSQPVAMARKSVFTAYEEALAAVDPFLITKKNLQRDGSVLRVADSVFDLGAFRHVSVIGAGKAGIGMAAAAEDILGERIFEGCVNVPEKDNSTDLRRTEIRVAGHPLPDEHGVAGACRILEIAGKAEKDDLLICLISGGGSSLLPVPRAPVTLADKQLVTSLLLRSGASISEINTVRKHISAIKGGWLAKKAWPATLLSLVLSDVLHDPLEFIASGPTVADTTRFSDAGAVVARYGLQELSPTSVRELLQAGMAGAIEETPKPGDACFAGVCNLVIANNQSAKTAFADSLRQKGFEINIVDRPISGTMAEAKSYFACELKKLSCRRESGVPQALIAGGEIALAVRGNGRGGRNQHLALEMFEELRDCPGALFAALSTDGIDGPTDASGAIVDAAIVDAAERLALNSEQFLQSCDSYEFFRQAGGLVCTGYTGSNVNDLFVLLII